MTSKVQAEKVRSSAGIEGLPSLQRGQALDDEEKDSLCSNFVSRLDSGLGAGTTCSSMDGYDNVNMAVGVSLTRSLNAPRETSAGEVFGRQVEFVNDKSSDDAMPSEEGAASYDDEPGLCSEEDVLNFTFKACDTEGTGRVAASVIVRYLQEMTGQSQDGRLQVLHNMLDPERKDIAIDRGDFHLTMRSWIANCTQDGCYQSDCTCAKGTGSSATREASELINNIADLKYANRKLRDQNNSLQKALEVSDETNLQLSKELTKLKNHLMSSQRTIHSLQSVVEELEDAKSAGREARERVHQLGTECKELKKENEALVAQLWSASGKIEKMERDKRQLKYRIDELLTQNADMTKQIREAQNLLISKDALIFEENILIEELKMSKAKSCKVIEGLRAELKKSQGKICQDLFSCKLGVWKSSPGLPPNRAVWFPASLQQEIRESQKEEGFETLPDPVCGLMPQQDHGDHFQEILSHIKAKRHGFLFRRTVNEMVDQLNVHAAAFMTLLRADSGQQLNVQQLRKELEQTIQAVVQKLHLLAPIKDSWDESMEVLEGACMQCQQEYLNTKHKLADTIRELELENVLRKEAEEQAVVAEERAEEAMLEAEAIRTRSLGASKLDEAWEDVAALGRDAEVPTMKVDGRSLTSNQNEEKLCPLELQVWQPVNEAKAEALEKMAAALDAAEARVKAWKVKASEAERMMVEMEQAVAAAGVKADTEGDKALLYLVEAEKLKGEIESLMMQAEESTKRTSAMEEQMAELSQMLSAAELEASSAQHRAVLAEERQLVALATILGGDSQRKIAAEQAMGTHPSGSSPSHSTKMFVGELQSCLGSEKNVANEGAAQPPCEAADEANDSSANRKQEPDVQHLSRETLGQLHHHGPCPLAGRCKGHGSSGHCPSLLDALNLEHCWSCQPFGIQKHFRPLSLGRHREGVEKPSPSEEHRTEAGEAQTAARNILGGTKSLKADDEPALSPEAEAQLPATTLPEEEDSAPISSLRLLLSNFTLPGLDPSCRSAGSSTRGPRCTVAPSMPTLPEEEEEGSEHRDTTQNSKPNLPGTGTRMNTTPAIVLPEVFNTSDKESDQAAHIRCHSPVQRRSSRNSRASLSSASSLTSVDGDGHMYNLVNDELPDMELSDEDRKKNTELLEEAKQLSERFLSRRSRRSRSSASDSPPELDVPVGRTMVVPSPQAGEEPPPSAVRDKDMKHLEVPRTRAQDTQLKSEKDTRKLSPVRKTIESRQAPPGTMCSQVVPSGKVVAASVQRKDLELSACRESKSDHGSHTKGSEDALASPTKLRGPERKAFPASPCQALISDFEALKAGTEQASARARMPCRAEIKSLSSQPLLRAVSWECLELDGELGESASPPVQTAQSFGFDDVLDANQLKSFNCKELPGQPKLQKLTKLREENKLMRNQTLAGQRLPDLSEINEQDRGPSPVPCPAVDGSCNITPSIPDSLLRKLKVQRSLSAGLPPLTEKEIENTFIQLSLAFKNDSYTLETRLGLAERERNLAEDNTEKELENFKSELKSSSSLWVQSELRNAQERLLETVGVLQRLAVRLSGRAEMVGAVRQEKRMSKATEVMMQYVENLKRMYEKDHAELTEYKKLANQNSSRSYSPYGDGSDDGVPRTARSMSLTLGKTVPRRRVSVAVLPKFINFPGHPPSSSTMPTVALMESQSSTETNSSNSSSNASSSDSITTIPSTIPSSSSRIGLHSSPMLSPLVETKQNGDKEVERPVTGDVQPLAAEVTSTVTKAKIEEDAFNKGYQEGLKAQLSQERKESRQEPGKEEGWSEEAPTPSSFTEGRKSSKFEEVSALMVKLCPRPLKHRGVIWFVAMMVLLFAVLVNIFSSQRSPCEDTPSTPGVKGSCPSAHGSPWPFSRLWRKNRAQA
ncbi:uncharacterized protein mrvi1 isoform X1 [Leucoraja erinacea]|uniref:uncharacterized protein mrvi1 isoform X1 n=1 Tax=Leucoraja erinaceus TaxID=7782 RepID=UPI002457123B|nr:uncharacterized protein mrvi1 isoform X1 [Leucoraja erinacea]XP_055505324.1 uncharacterized protein mrvi1 isoform X1 [Leucoraja erinacea]